MLFFGSFITASTLGDVSRTIYFLSPYVFGTIFLVGVVVDPISSCKLVITVWRVLLRGAQVILLISRLGVRMIFLMLGTFLHVFANTGFFLWWYGIWSTFVFGFEVMINDQLRVPLSHFWLIYIYPCSGCTFHMLNLEIKIIINLINLGYSSTPIILSTFYIQTLIFNVKLLTWRTAWRRSCD